MVDPGYGNTVTNKWNSNMIITAIDLSNKQQQRHQSWLREAKCQPVTFSNSNNKQNEFDTQQQTEQQQHDCNSNNDNNIVRNKQQQRAPEQQRRTKQTTTTTMEHWRKRKAINVEKGAVVSLWNLSAALRYLWDISFKRMVLDLWTGETSIIEMRTVLLKWIRTT